MRAVVIEDFNGSIELVRDPDTCDVLVFEDLESACSQRVWYKGLEKDCRLKKKERKWIILKFPWSSTCAQSAEE